MYAHSETDGVVGLVMVTSEPAATLLPQLCRAPLKLPWEIYSVWALITSKKCTHAR